jgi:hypothetical protein
MSSSGMNYKNFRKPRRSKIVHVTQQNQKINQQPNKPNLQTSKENKVWSIPTAVNGDICINNTDKSDQSISVTKSVNKWW